MATRHGGRWGRSWLGTSSSFGLLTHLATFSRWEEATVCSSLPGQRHFGPTRCSFDVLLLFLTWFFMLTTRWRTDVDSGNSACTRCWLSAALWLSPQSPGASGPTAGGFSRPSGLDIDSRSVSERKRERIEHCNIDGESTSCLYCRCELTCPLITATCLWNCPLSKPGSFCGTQGTKV